MEKTTAKAFIHKTESLVRPQDVTAISFLGDFNKILPLSMQEKIMKEGSVKVPYMGFIVDPYCLFLAYRVKDTERAAALLPQGYELCEARIFEDDQPCPLVVIGAFSVRTSAFIGNRLECYLIARRKETGKVSWLIVDYETNTNSYDPKQGFCGYTCDPAFLTATPYGELLVDFQNRKNQNRFTVEANLEAAPWGDLNADLWIEGNMSIDYGGDLRGAQPSPFSLIFDPYLMARAKRLSLDQVRVQANDFLGSIIGPETLVSAAYFPYSQHFIIKQDLPDNAISEKKDLEFRAQEFLNARGIKLMSGDDIKRPLIRGLVVSTVVTWGALVILGFLALAR